jgi:formimidoylglutamate deiminase
MSTLYRPELLYSKGSFLPNAGILAGDSGEVQAITANADSSPAHVVDLPGKVLLPGFVNAHSHSFQRLIRGKSESRGQSGKDFWSWRNTMYHAAARLTPDEVYDIARMAFLEMVLSGTTTVGEFHYVHTAPDGRPYDDPNLLSKQVIAAARSVGIRIVLLRTAYLRSGFQLPRDQGQVRFFESAGEFLANTAALLDSYPSEAASVQFGIAPHSIRAVPLQDLKEIVAFARQKQLPIHMHVAEQVGENIACSREYGLTPVALLGKEKLLGPDFTAVHAIHTYPEELRMLADAAATICSCPTTERNLGDGVIAADHAMKKGIRVAFGSDSQAQIDPLEDARELDYHLRLQHEERAILDQINGQPLATRLFECATLNGARALALSAGELSPGSFADFFTVALDDLSIAGHFPEDLLSILVFSLNRSAIRDVAVNGKLILRDGRHVQQAEIVSRYRELHRKVWAGKGSTEVRG